MASYCGNNLTITSQDASFIDTLVEIAIPPQPGVISKLPFLKSFKRKPDRNYGLLGFMRPMPEELKLTITNGFSGKTPPWHNWMVEKWGCAYDVAVESAVRKNANEVQFKFDSRYSPPVAAIDFGAKTHGFQYRLVYCESGNQFAGIATDKAHQEFEFTFEVHPRAEGVPQEIIDDFGLVAIYEELKEDPKNAN